MFKKFDPTKDVTGTQQLKSSVQKGIRAKLVEQYPPLAGDTIESILPKKENFKVVKCKDHVELIATEDGQVQFIKHRDLPYIPSLRLLHKFPYILPHQQVDQGAIRPVLNGSHIMAPGLKSAGARLADGVQKDQIVAVMAEGKEHAMAIGQQKMRSEEIRGQAAGAAIDNLHFLNDGIWRLATVQ
ncbi:PUA domain-containing protein [Aphelenchoides fujianensis]|nr:PUA domain-containing protein [Aphelenchoides fujianensis]